MTDRCQACDRPLATQADYATTREGERRDLCWRAWNHGMRCDNEPIDWRTRALEAEATLADVSKQLDDAYAATAVLIIERDEAQRSTGRAVFRNIEAKRAIAGRDRAIDALTTRVAELLAELRPLRKFYGKFRHAEIESLT